ncbi:MAG: anion permease [Spirochaetaceae bacterium]|jgi:di/tricarboxylate transporter|nr:anion permease [Spirochaetaceae bacterium]
MPAILLKISATLAFPLFILLVHPLGMNWRQSVVVSGLLLTVIWWTTGIVKKIPASIFLLVLFAFFSGVPLKTVFAFPLSESFFLIALTYLFSQAISKSGLIDKVFKPLLFRLATTPFRVILAIIAMYIITIYIIPQPLARLIIVAVMFKEYFESSNLDKESRQVLMFACVIYYVLVNMMLKSADIIVNTAIVAFAHIEMDDGLWLSYMAVPTFITGILVSAVFFFIFRKNLTGISIQLERAGAADPRGMPKFSVKEKSILVLIALTVAFWMSSGLHHISPTIITACATGILFIIRALNIQDLKAIDSTTLVFLSAAFSIGGVIQGCGAADRIFSALKVLFPPEYSLLYAAILVLVCMVMHMILGSNTTTLSVVIPGLLVISAGRIAQPVLMFIAYTSMIFHAILPFHSVSMMICTSYNYFPGSYVTRMGVPLTALVFFVILFVYIPWWRFMGYF